MFIDYYLIYLFIDWLCGLALRLKGQNLNPLWTDLICSKFWFSCQLITSEMCNLFIRFFMVIFIIPACNYLCRLFGKFRNNREQKMVDIDWFQVESVLLGTLSWTAASFLGLFLSNFSNASYFVFKVTLLCLLFVVTVNTIHKHFSVLLPFRTPLPPIFFSISTIHHEETRLSINRNRNPNPEVGGRYESAVAPILSCINL